MVSFATKLGFDVKVVALEPGVDPADDPGGFVNYYKTASLGRYTPHVTLSPVVQFDSCPLPPAQFPNCAIARGDIGAFTAGMDMMRLVYQRLRAKGVITKKTEVQ